MEDSLTTISVPSSEVNTTVLHKGHGARHNTSPTTVGVLQTASARPGQARTHEPFFTPSSPEHQLICRLRKSRRAIDALLALPGARAPGVLRRAWEAPAQDVPASPGSPVGVAGLLRQRSDPLPEAAQPADAGIGPRAWSAPADFDEPSCYVARQVLVSRQRLCSLVDSFDAGGLTADVPSSEAGLDETALRDWWTTLGETTDPPRPLPPPEGAEATSLSTGSSTTERQLSVTSSEATAVRDVWSTFFASASPSSSSLNHEDPGPTPDFCDWTEQNVLHKPSVYSAAPSCLLSPLLNRLTEDGPCAAPQYVIPGTSLSCRH